MFLDTEIVKMNAAKMIKEKYSCLSKEECDDIAEIVMEAEVAEMRRLGIIEDDTLPAHDTAIN